jgi:AraC family transcriptional regulator of adaptative response / DNA-3-methyladenine glycosylase II
MRLIADGIVDRDGVRGLASRLGYSERQLNRQLVAEVGAGPLALARAQRARTARILIETSVLPFTEIAFAAGFASIRQFNDTVREVFASTPTELRVRNKSAPSVPTDRLVLRLAYRSPLALTPLLEFLGRRAVAGVESFDGQTYTRSLSLPHGDGVVSLSAHDERAVRCELKLADLRDLTTAVQRARRLLDLDADPTSVDAALGADPALEPLVLKVPGRRVPGAVDGNELAVRAVLGQQVSVAGARTAAARLVERYGQRLSVADERVTHVFPDPATLAGLDSTSFAMPRARGRALVALCGALASGAVVLDAGVDRDETFAALTGVEGVGPWTASYLAMRALGDPDAFLPTDLGVRRGLERLGLPSDPRSATARAERWRPWRSYALMHLWGALEA